MLWVGNPTVLPLDPVVLPDGTGYTLTRNGSGDLTEQWRRPEHVGRPRRRPTPSSSPRPGCTQPTRRLLAPMGVRYVVLPSVAGVGRGRGRAADRPPARRARGAARPGRLRSGTGLVLYENPGVRPDPGGGHRVGRRPASPRHRRTPPAPRSTPTWPAPGPSASASGARGHACCGARRTTRRGTPPVAARRSVISRRSDGRTATSCPAGGRSRSPYTAQWQRWAWIGGVAADLAGGRLRWRRTRVRRDPASARRAGAPSRTEGALRPARRGPRRGRVLVGAGMSTDESRGTDAGRPSGHGADRAEVARRFGEGRSCSS